MKPESLQRLCKLMQLSLSENDNEALSSLRKANRLLAEHKMNWQDLFKMIVVREQISLAEYQKRHADAWEKAFGFRPQTWGNASNVNQWKATFTRSR